MSEMKEPTEKKQGRSIGRYLLIAVGVLFVCGVITIIIGALGSSDPDPATEDVADRVVEVAELEESGNSGENAEPAPTEEPEPTEIPATATDVPPTSTPVPTNTPAPTSTPEPTSTPTPAPDPIVLEGSGDDLIDFENPFTGDLLGIEVEGSGSSNFAVIPYDEDGENIDLLVNEIGSYSGRHLMVIDDIFTESPAGFEVQSNGAWTITVFPVLPDYIDVHSASDGPYAGSGDDFFLMVNEDGENRAAITNGGSSNFVVFAVTSGRDLLVNEIGSYEGTVRTPNDEFILFSVLSDGNWTIDMSGN